jgi:DNA-binding CsgD family transcriptional regulator
MNTVVSNLSQVPSQISMVSSDDHHPSLLLLGVMEGLLGGIILVTPEGQLLYANACAHHLWKTHLGQSLGDRLPQRLWKVCQVLFDSQEEFSDLPITVEDEICHGQIPTLRIQAKWLTPRVTSQQCVVIILEDCLQCCQNLAIAERQKYGLTPREAEVWARQQARYSYKEIAKELHISVNTVKKHIKSIRAKRQSALWLEEDQVS